MENETQLNTDQVSLKSKINRAGIASIILGAILILAIFYIRGIFAVAFNSIEAEIPVWVKLMTWFILLMSVSLIILGSKAKKVKSLKAKTYLIVAAFISWVLLLLLFFSSFAIGTASSSLGLIYFFLIVFLIFIHIGIKAANSLFAIQK